MWTATAFVIALVIVALLFLQFASYPQTRSVNGTLVPSTGLLTLSAPASGVVREVSAIEGSNVVEGELILTLSLDKVTTDGRSARAERISMGKEITRASLDKGRALEASLESQEAAAKSRITGIAEQIHTLNGTVHNLESMISLAESTVRDYDGLRQERIVTELQYRDALTKVLTTKQNLSETHIRIADLRQEAIQLRFDVKRLKSEREANRAASSAEVISSRDKELTYSTESGVALTAPSAGRVTSLRVHAGSWVGEGSPVGAVMPEGATLLAELWVPSTAIASAEPGAKVRLKYDAFPYQKFGHANATIIRVAGSPTAVADLPGDIQAQEGHYRVLAKLDSQNVVSSAKTFSLIPGMKFNAEMIIEQRTLMDWILRPITANL